MEARLNRLSDNVVRSGNDIDNLFSRMSKAAAGFLTLNAAQGFVRDLIRVRSEFQQLDIAFTTMLGSKQKADRLTQDLIKFAATTPFGMKDAANAAKQLLAYGSNVENVRDELRMLGDVASGVSQPIGDLVYLYGTLRTQGRAYMMDIRQFAGRGIPIYRELAKVLGVAEGKVNDLVSAGKVGFAEVEKAFKNMTAEGSMFGGLMAKQSRTIQGELERLGDAFDIMLNKIGTEQEGVISASIQGLSFLVENYEAVLDIITGIAFTYGSYRAAVIATAAAQSIAIATTRGWTVAQLLHYRALLLAEAAQKLLNRTMLANPYVAFGTAVGALIFILYKLSDSLSTAEKAQERLNREQTEATARLDDIKIKAGEYLSVIQNTNSTEYQRVKAFERLKTLYPDRLNNMSREKFMLLSIADAQKLLNDLQDREAVNDIGNRLAVYQNEIVELTNKAKEYQDTINQTGDIGGTLSRALLGLNEQLEIAKTNAESLQNSFERENEALELSKMTNEQKLAYYERQLQKTRELSDKIRETELHTKSWQQSLGMLNVNPLEMQINSIIAKIDNIKNADTSVSVRRTLGDIDTEIKDKKESLSNASTREEYQAIDREIKKLEAERSRITGEQSKTLKVIEKFAEKKIDILRSLADHEAEIRNSELSNNEQELARARKFYTDLRREIEDFNKKAPANERIKAGTFQLIDNLEQRETGNIRYNQETELLKTQLGNQLEIYRKFQDARGEIGVEAARRMYETEKDFTDDYRSLLMGEIIALQGRGAIYGSLTGPEQERLKALNDSLDEFDKSERDRTNERTRYLLTTYASFEQKRTRLHRQADEDMRLLDEEGRKLRKKALEDEEVELYRTELEGNEKFQELLRTLDMSGTSISLQALKQGRKYVDSLIDGIDDPNVKSQLNKIFGDWFDMTTESVQNENFGNVVQLVDGFGRLVDTATQFDGTLSTSLKTIGAMVGQVGQLSQTLGQTIGKVGDGFSKGGGIASIVGAVFSVIGGVVGAIEDSQNKKWQKAEKERQHAQEFQLKQLDAATRILEYQLSLINDIYGADRVKAYADAAKQAFDSVNNSIKDLPTSQFLSTGDAQNDNLVQILNQFGSIEELDKRLREIKDRQKDNWFFPAFQKDYAPEIQMLEAARKFFMDGSVDDYRLQWTSIEDITQEEITKLTQLLDEGKFDEVTASKIRNIIEQYDLWKNALNEMRAELTGTTFGGITDEIVSMFERGTVAAEDFADSFEKIMQRAILQSLKRDFLETQLQGWYESFADAADPLKNDKKGLTASEISGLQKAYNDIVENAQKQFELIKQATGVNFDSDKASKESGLSGAISGITESTAGRLESEFGGLRLAQLQLVDLARSNSNVFNEQVRIMNAKLAVLNSINANTGRTADNTDRLANIETAIVQLNSKISNTDSLMRGAG
ncbi:tape measure protein, partial [Parapedobacter indicus]